MQRAKKIWEENKVLLVLAVILVVCLVVFSLVALTYFYGSGNNVYGNRLEETKKVPIKKEKLNELEELAKKNETVTEASATLKGKIIYLNLTFKNDVKMDDAKKVAISLLEGLSSEELTVYDIQMTIYNPKEDGGYTLMGARNASGSGEVIWNNYNLDYLKKESAE